MGRRVFIRPTTTGSFNSVEHLLSAPTGLVIYYFLNLDLDKSHFEAEHGLFGNVQPGPDCGLLHQLLPRAGTRWGHGHKVRPLTIHKCLGTAN